MPPKGNNQRGGGGGGNQQQQQRKAAPPQQQQHSDDDSNDDGALAAPRTAPAADFLSGKNFGDLATKDNSIISSAIVAAIKDRMKFSSMTKVQCDTIPLSAPRNPETGCFNDVLAKAQTGTGKTVAFLVPMIEHCLAKRTASNGIRGLILSPTRELAMQIHNECEGICGGLKGSPVKSIVLYGGRNMSTDLNLLKGNVDIIVATPGRLIDHLKNNNRGIVERIAELETLTLDEADRMLEMGFRPDIEKILSYLPSPAQGRQTLLFSATIPPEIVKIAPKILQREFYFVESAIGKIQLSTAEKSSQPVGAGGAGGGKKGSAAQLLVADDPMATVAQVKQEYAVCPFDEHIPALFAAVEQHIKEQSKSYKIIVFFTTARLTQLYSEIADELGVRVLEIHSRKSQSQRQKASDAFRDNTKVIAFSSDVTARGLDYPDVSLVIQVGAASDTEQYIHRLGRTARAGKIGKGILLIAPEEQYFLTALARLPLAKVGIPQFVNPATAEAVPQAIQATKYQTKAMAYSAWLGYYNGMCSRMRWSKDELVRRANRFATANLYLDGPPELQKKTVGKMGLKGVPGLVLEGQGVRSFREEGNGGGGGRGGGRQGGRGGQQQQQQRGGGGQQQHRGGQQQQQPQGTFTVRAGDDAPSAPRGGFRGGNGGGRGGGHHNDDRKRPRQDQPGFFDEPARGRGRGRFDQPRGDNQVQQGGNRNFNNNDNNHRGGRGGGYSGGGGRGVGAHQDSHHSSTQQQSSVVQMLQNAQSRNQQHHQQQPNNQHQSPARGGGGAGGQRRSRFTFNKDE